MNFTNKQDYSMILYNEVKGPTAQYVYIKPRITVLPKTTQLINITVITTKDSPTGHYEGELIMKVYRGKK
ncbi:hypothetical protein KY309_03630 [Candidatus Woesearchaeota archaeon]|nr:hypothetical protein [Candidatus Woesearchaeota archaeon]MBW3016673.1 hypothetical protein [Candidatus Woesearchaeota archaeon]